MTLRDSLLAAVVAVIWGLNFVVIEQSMGGVPPLLFLAVRFLVVLVPALFLVPRPHASWRVVAAVGLFMSLGQFSLLYLSIAAGMPPGLAGLVLQAQVVFTVLIAAGVLREVPTALQVLGVCVGTAGLLLVVLGGGGQVPGTALLLCLGAALSWGIGNTVARASKVTGGLSLTVWSALVVPVPALGLALLVDGPGGVADGLAAFGWRAALGTAYTALLASLVGYGVFNTLLGRNRPAAVVPWVLLVPPVSIASAWLLLGDVPTATEVAGGVVMLAGVLVAQRRPQRPQRPSRRHPPAADRAPGAVEEAAGASSRPTFGQPSRR